jgi:hypothetical protein
MPIRALLVWLLVAGGAGAAFAGGSSAPFDYRPDPALQTESRSQLEARVRRACTIVQARFQSVAEATLSGPCGCYASRTMRALSADEIQAYRDTGYFNDGARAKALAALDACRLPRPV